MVGQGTDSCGGYEVDFNPYYEGLTTGMWTTRDHSSIRLSEMGVGHIRGAIRVCERAFRASTFSSDAEMWEQWIDSLNNELERRGRNSGIPHGRRVDNVNTSSVRGATVRMLCHCGAEYVARTADIKRGWAMSCSKHCAAVRRTYGKRKAKPVEGCEK